MTRLERLLAAQEPVFKRVAWYYTRRSWGSSVFTFEDYMSEAIIVACDVYRRKARERTDDELGRLVNRGVLFRLRRLWRNEVRQVCCGDGKIPVTPISLDARPEDRAALEIPYAAEVFFKHVLEEATTLLTSIQREMLDVLLTPERDPIGWMMTYDLFKVYPHLPLQRAEIWYLAQHFGMSEADVKVHFHDMRDKLKPFILERAA